jgi:hypothetical protein
LERYGSVWGHLGQFVTFSPGPNSNPNVEHGLQRWLVVNPNPSAADGFRAGWMPLARFVGPRLRDWESRWRRAMLDSSRLSARVITLTHEVSRLQDERYPPGQVGDASGVSSR